MKSGRFPRASTTLSSPTNQAAGQIPPQGSLPERYEILAKFFDNLDSSIPLLRLKSSANICPKVECLIDRRFSHSQLAQIKFIMRHEIKIKRVLAFDERTSCMFPDLHISINVDAIKNDAKLKSESGNLHLRKIFQARLADFSKSHPEVLQKLGRNDAENASPNLSKTSLQPLVVPVPELPLHNSTSKDETAAAAPSSAELLYELARNGKTVALRASPACLPPSCVPVTPSKVLDSLENVTPVKLIYTPTRLISVAPALHPPKRCYRSLADNCTSSPNKLIRRLPHSRSLKFDSPEKDEHEWKYS
ncbi:CDT1-like protein a, chloroplastic [Morella rubra]|uniref:CDT1-like protein a, chloroplastic n=1 Tax=Morella rubra TaxID=262757 RepID=A0A6A1VWQ1_9ROSI|nr:CDT1-like protein a, chloroplastic [Morella rubra]